MKMKELMLAFVMFGGLVFGSCSTASAISGGGIDLSKPGNNYGIVNQIELQSGQLFTGMLFVVDSSSTLDRDVASSGNFKSPFSTIDYAIGRASARTANANPAANSGSLILVLPGHAETINEADEIDIDLAGLTIWGVGSGAARPTLTYTVAAGEVTIGANSVTIGNMRFISSVTDVLKAINVEGSFTYPRIINCEFGVDSAGTDEFLETIYLDGTNTGAVIANNVIDMGLGGATSAIKIDDECTRVTIRENIIRGDYGTANINGIRTASANVLIEDNLLVNGVAGNVNAQPTIELLTGTSGVIRNNSISSKTTAVASIASDTTFWFENYFNSDVGGTVTGTVTGFVHDGL